MSISIEPDNILPYLKDREKLENKAVSAKKLLFSGQGRGKEYLGWLNIDDINKSCAEKIKTAARRIKQKSQTFIVIGIGGSYLGAKAALDFIKSPNYNLTKKDTPNIYFVGNSISADSIKEIIEFTADRDFSINVISKSGGTIESSLAFRIFRKILEERYGKSGASERIYATTDKKHGILRRMAENEGYEAFEIPENVGGRYSVLTPVGLLPLAVAGADTEKMMLGAKRALKAAENDDMDSNPSMKYAAMRNGMNRVGKDVEVLSGFQPCLRYFGEWWKQLFAESEGKEYKGIFPTYADYTADLHSIGQYIQQGKRIMFETFIDIKREREQLFVPWENENGDELNYISGREFKWINNQAKKAVIQAHTDGDVPNMSIEVESRSEESFGELAAFFEASCGISGYMLGVNPFDQPGVEEYKKNMFALFGKGRSAEVREFADIKG